MMITMVIIFILLTTVFITIMANITIIITLSYKDIQYTYIRGEDTVRENVPLKIGELLCVILLVRVWPSCLRSYTRVYLDVCVYICVCVRAYRGVMCVCGVCVCLRVLLIQTYCSKTISQYLYIWCCHHPYILGEMILR